MQGAKIPMLVLWKMRAFLRNSPCLREFVRWELKSVVLYILLHRDVNHSEARVWLKHTFTLVLPLRIFFPHSQVCTKHKLP